MAERSTRGGDRASRAADVVIVCAEKRRVDYVPMLEALCEMIDACVERGAINFADDTRVFAGHLA